MTGTDMTPAEIRAARESLGLTQAQIAPLVGYGGKRAVQTISDIERGKVAPAPYAIRLLRLYLSGVRPDDWPVTPTPADAGATGDG